MEAQSDVARPGAGLTSRPAPAAGAAVRMEQRGARGVTGLDPTVARKRIPTAAPFGSAAPLPPARFFRLLYYALPVTRAEAPV